MNVEPLLPNKSEVAKMYTNLKDDIMEVSFKVDKANKTLGPGRPKVC